MRFILPAIIALCLWIFVQIPVLASDPYDTQKGAGVLFSSILFLGGTSCIFAWSRLFKLQKSPRRHFIVTGILLLLIGSLIPRCVDALVEHNFEKDFPVEVKQRHLALEKSISKGQSKMSVGNYPVENMKPGVVYTPNTFEMGRTLTWSGCLMYFACAIAGVTLSFHGIRRKYWQIGLAGAIVVTAASVFFALGFNQSVYGEPTVIPGHWR